MTHLANDDHTRIHHLTGSVDFSRRRRTQPALCRDATRRRGRTPETSIAPSRRSSPVKAGQRSDLTWQHLTFSTLSAISNRSARRFVTAVCPTKHSSPPRSNRHKFIHCSPPRRPISRPKWAAPHRGTWLKAPHLLCYCWAFAKCAEADPLRRTQPEIAAAQGVPDL
jgi:hypothetical protein